MTHRVIITYEYEGAASGGTGRQIRLHAEQHFGCDSKLGLYGGRIALKFSPVSPQSATSYALKFSGKFPHTVIHTLVVEECE